MPKKGTYIRFIHSKSSLRRVAFVADQRAEDVPDISLPLPAEEIGKRQRFHGHDSCYRLLNVTKLPDGSIVCDPHLVKMVVSTEGGRERFSYGIEKLEPDNQRRWEDLIRWLTLLPYDNSPPVELSVPARKYVVASASPTVSKSWTTITNVAGRS